MFSTQSIDYSIGAPCRTMDCIPGQDAWIVGTCASLHGDSANTLQIVAYDADSNELRCRHTYNLTDDEDGINGEPIRCVATIPPTTDNGIITDDDNDDVVRVAVATEQGSSVLLYELSSSSSGNDNDDYATTNDSDAPAAKLIAKFTPDGGFGASIMKLSVSKGGSSSGEGSGNSPRLLLALDNASHLSVWDIETNEEIRSVDLDVGATAIQWDPHSSAGDGTTMVAVGVQKSLHLLDWRTNTSIPTGICTKLQCRSIVHDFDYNPNKPHTIAIATHDGTARLWDLRQPKRPILTVTGGHSHWMSTIAYNPCHDQLLLTTGTEGQANVWRLGSVSSAPLLQSRNRRVAAHSSSHHHHHAASSYGGGGGGGHHTTMTMPSEAIYAAKWAGSEAWMYATVSWDGTMALHHVPSKEKYKILL
jgi:EARP and GARP complex-interacting protein 1